MISEVLEMALEKKSRLTRSTVIELPVNQSFQVTEVKLCVGHCWRLSTLMSDRGTGNGSGEKIPVDPEHRN